MRLAPKFFANRPDGLHCVQASVLTALSSVDSTLTWEDVDRLTEFTPALWTWTIKAAATLSQFINGVKIRTVFDYQRFATDGESYLIQQWLPEKLNTQRRFSSEGFANERRAATEFLKNGTIEQVASFDKETFHSDLQRHLIIAIVNAPAMNEKNGYSSHAVTVYGASEAGNWLFLHDPGLPPRASQRVETSSFWRAFTGEMILVPHGKVPYGATYNANDPCYCGSGNKFKPCFGDHGL